MLRSIICEALLTILCIVIYIYLRAVIFMAGAGVVLGEFLTVADS